MPVTTFKSRSQREDHPRGENHRGFTIVELLIVVVVIGILAAIALVSYNGVNRQAVAATLKSDLKNASTQLDLARVKNGNYPQDDGSTLSRSEGITLEYSSDGTAEGFDLPYSLVTCRGLEF
jgi:prepilin-type N-terminal cleavage/methylation domain-containing protein